jgi:hypothetical protein
MDDQGESLADRLARDVAAMERRFGAETLTNFYKARGAERFDRLARVPLVQGERDAVALSAMTDEQVAESWCRVLQRRLGLAAEEGMAPFWTLSRAVALLGSAEGTAVRLLFAEVSPKIMSPKSRWQRELPLAVPAPPIGGPMTEKSEPEFVPGPQAASRELERPAPVPLHIVPKETFSDADPCAPWREARRRRGWPEVGGW